MKVIDTINSYYYLYFIFNYIYKYKTIKNILLTS